MLIDEPPASAGSGQVPPAEGSGVLLLDVEIAADEEAPWKARRLVSAAAAALADELCERAILVVSELVTNAVRHGVAPGGNVKLKARAFGEQGLQIEVIDTGRAAATRSGENGGFGLAIVETVADRVRYDKTGRWRVIADFTTR